MYSLYIDLYIYKNSHCTKETHAYRHKQQRERQIPQRGKCTLELVSFFFFFYNLISIYMCVPKTRLSAKRFIHPKFIFVRANIKKFFKGGGDTEDRLSDYPANHLGARAGVTSIATGEAGACAATAASEFSRIPGLLTGWGALIGSRDEDGGLTSPPRTSASEAAPLCSALPTHRPKQN